MTTPRLRHMTIRRQKDPDVSKGVYSANPNDPFFRDLVKTDLELAKNVRLSLDKTEYEALLVQSVLGHAQEGHAQFHKSGATFPDATLSDVILAAGLNLDEVRQQRQDKIDQVQEWISLAKEGKTDRLMVRGKPLLGVQFLQNYIVEPHYVLRGMILAGLMDNYEWRQNTVKHYGGKTIDGKALTIGGGTSVLVDKDKLLKWDQLGIERLAEGEATSALWKELRENGVLTTADNPNAEVVYVRKKKGLGTSDDSAFILTGELYKTVGEVAARSALLGAFVIDGVDTYDKCVKTPVESGYDELIGRELRKEYSSLVPDETIYALIYHAAKSCGNYVVSSSHKRLIQVQEMADPKLPTLLHHLRFMEERKVAPFNIGFERQASGEFYRSVQERVDHLEKQGY